MTASEMDLLGINTIRTLAIDAIQKAKSGHPGTPMGMAPVAYGLWQKRLNFDPADPIWPNRDRFILSAGHASMLLYALLHLTRTQTVNADYQPLGRPSVTLDDIKSFRQLDSACPGHPEYHLTSGVEATTGPLGQGVAMSVGLAIAERWLGAYLNRPGLEVVDWRTYALCGDGCMMEGISGEAASLAGHLKLEKLCWIYDSNRVSIEGHTEIAFTEDVATRFLGYGWNVLHVRDANDEREVLGAFDLAANEGRGLVIYEYQEGRGIGLMAKLQAYELQDAGLDAVEANHALGFKCDCRDFRLPAAILRDLGVKRVRLLSNNPRKAGALAENGTEVVAQLACEAAPNPHSFAYLRSKKEKMGHALSSWHCQSMDPTKHPPTRRSRAEAASPACDQCG